MGHVCSFTALPDLTRKQQRDRYEVLAALNKAGGWFSVFEATENQDIAQTMTWIMASDWVEKDGDPGYPWTKIKLTEHGRSVLEGNRHD